MNNNPLHIAIIWHMHQPYYKDPETGRYDLPWVRLHSIKDYYDMVSVLEEFPAVHQTFNLAPSLLEQIEDYASGKAKDLYYDISLKPPSELSKQEKIFILENFFMLNWGTMVYPYPRYRELLLKRGEDIKNESLSDNVRYFSDQDILDLQVWFNLSWFDPIHRDGDPFLRAMVEKGRGYTQEEKVKILEKQYDIIKMVIPKYKEIEERGIIELTTSPFYHPILPLLCDSFSAKEALPNIKLPHVRFKHPEDARAQLSMGIKYFSNLFGHKPYGCWPSEGSVSNELIPIFLEEGIEWIATDEGILANSLNHHIRRDNRGMCLEPEVLYKVYSVGSRGERLKIIFRDHILSDLFGFVYSKWNEKEAINDFIERLHKIRHSLISRTNRLENFIVPIILDGENPWEHYKNDGRDFLLGLYRSLSDDPCLKCVSVKEHLNTHPHSDSLPRLFAGSWIDSNFKIWIGHHEDNTAWEHLAETRNSLIAFEKKIKQNNSSSDSYSQTLNDAWKAIYIAEGSDWFWWYGDDHSSIQDKDYDELFRKNLKRVYRLIGENVPPSLDIPILTEEKEIVPPIEPRALLSPHIDGEVTNYYEWLSAGRIDKDIFGEAMHQARSFLQRIYYGFDLANLFIRVDFDKELAFLDLGNELALNILTPKEVKLILKSYNEKYRFYINNNKREIYTFSVGGIIELQIPFSYIMSKEGDELTFFITIEKDGNILERWPYRGYISLQVPSKDFEAWNWYV